MKVLLINGSRRKSGCTYTALKEVADVLESEKISTEIIHVGIDAVNGSIDKAVKETAAMLDEVDGIVLGSPVYYASPSGEIQTFLDRLFYIHGDKLKHKPGAVVASARRAGTTAALDVLNKYGRGIDGLQKKSDHGRVRFCAPVRLCAGSHSGDPVFFHL